MATCFGCSTPIPDEPGTYYCDSCIAQQTREQANELRAFDALHRFADSQTNPTITED